MSASRRLIPRTARYELWKSLRDGGKVPDRINPSIAASWQRCIEADLSPVGLNISPVLQADEIPALLENNSVLLEIS